MPNHELLPEDFLAGSDIWIRSSGNWIWTAIQSMVSVFWHQLYKLERVCLNNTMNLDRKLERADGGHLDHSKHQTTVPQTIQKTRNIKRLYLQPPRKLETSKDRTSNYNVRIQLHFKLHQANKNKATSIAVWRLDNRRAHLPPGSSPSSSSPMMIATSSLMVRTSLLRIGNMTVRIPQKDVPLGPFSRKTHIRVA